VSGVNQIVAMGAALLITACSTEGAITPRQELPAMATSDAEQLLVRADQLKGLALGGATVSLPDAFRGRALQRLEAEVQSAARLGLREEERNATRTLVFWDPRASEAVLQVVADRRVASPDRSNPAWATTFRQWWARLQFENGRWWVVDQQDLPPDRWRYVASAG
jgi:hypothetical protein